MSADLDKKNMKGIDFIFIIIFISFFLSDIQEYYEVTILESSKCSGDQTHCPTPSDPSADLSAQPESSSASQMSQASEINPPPKPLTPKPKSVKSPAPPVPSGISPVKQTSPAASSVTPHLESTKVKYRAPPPPVQPGAISPASSPSSPTALPVSDAEKHTNSAETPEVSVNGTKPRVTATNSLSSEASISANSQSSSVSPDLNLVTVSALVSSTIQGLVPPAGPNKPPRTCPSPIKVPDATKASPSLASNTDPDNGIVTPSMSPISPSQGKLAFKQSPTGPAGPVNTELHLRWDQQSKFSTRVVNIDSFCIRSTLTN